MIVIFWRLKQDFQKYLCDFYTSSDLSSASDECSKSHVYFVEKIISTYICLALNIKNTGSMLLREFICGNSDVYALSISDSGV